MFPPAEAIKQCLVDEIKQRREEGCDVASAEAELEHAADDRDALSSLYDRLAALEPRDEFPFHEPSELGAIRSARPHAGHAPLLTTVSQAVEERIHGGWLGRCAGCALGKPLENQVFMHSAAKLRQYLEAAHAYPLDDFVPHDPAACKAVGLELLECEPSQRGNVRYMESDDDLRYTIMGLDILERRGADFSTRDVAVWWLDHLPATKCFTAEQAVYRNLMNSGAVHDLGQLTDEQLEYVRSYMNPYREWIGAQIRADGWALACPGDPQRAAEFAWRDASLSHVKNGIYGEMYCAAMIAAAAALEDPLEIVRAGLNEIPARSRLGEALRRTIAHCRSLGFDPARFEEAVEWLWTSFGAYHPVHTINNAAAVTAALLLGGRDFEKVITIAVLCGWDTDCNGATAGCICGAMLGAAGLPEKWTAPFNDTLMSEIPGYHPIQISELARRHAKVAARLRSTDA